MLHPHFGGEEQLFPGNAALLNGAAHFFLVKVTLSRVDVPIACPEGVADAALALVPGDLIHAVAQHGHLNAIAQCDEFHGVFLLIPLQARLPQSWERYSTLWASHSRRPAGSRSRRLLLWWYHAPCPGSDGIWAEDTILRKTMPQWWSCCDRGRKVAPPAPTPRRRVRRHSTPRTEGPVCPGDPALPFASLPWCTIPSHPVCDGCIILFNDIVQEISFGVHYINPMSVSIFQIPRCYIDVLPCQWGRKQHYLTDSDSASSMCTASR